MVAFCKSFAPVYNLDAVVLILGSMPGEESLKQNEYYAHKNNLFWHIIEELFNIKKDLEYKERLELLKKNKIALWDVIGRCKRDGSLDINIERNSVCVNNIKKIYTECKLLKAVFFNGKKAYELYMKKIALNLNERHKKIPVFIMPSTSPANASMKREEKLAYWYMIKEKNNEMICNKY